MKTACCFCLLLAAAPLFSQSILRGRVTDLETGEPLPGASIRILETGQTAPAAADGLFEITPNQPPPFHLTVSMMGYSPDEPAIASTAAPLTIALGRLAHRMEEVVVSASRMEEHLLQSPVTIERLSATDLRQSTAPSFFSELTRLKGVSYTESSLAWTSIQPRMGGGAAMLQLFDGMDMGIPILGHAVGNLGGLSELDVRQVELLPGPSSAMYGPNAFEGALLMTTKNPFDSPGLSAQMKTGLTRSDAGGTQPFSQAALRWAGVFNNKWACKVNLSAMLGTEWSFSDYLTDRNSKTTDRRLAPDFDGLHLYGDEYPVFLPIAEAAVLQPLVDALTPKFVVETGLPDSSIRPFLEAAISQFKPIQVTRTGYRDEDLLDDNRASNLSGSVGLHYRWRPDLEVSYLGHLGSGSGIVLAGDKYAIRDIRLQFHKAELRGKHFSVKAYATADHGGASFNVSALGALLNEAWSPSRAGWFPNYVGNYAAALIETMFTQNVLPDQFTPEMLVAAHQVARRAADAGRFEPGTAEFNEAVREIRGGFFKKGGARFFENSRMYHAEGFCDFTHFLKKSWSLQAGGSARRYALFSKNTVFNEDPDGDGHYERIGYNEFGGFAQASRSLWDDHLKINASARLDKNENFEWQFSPRISAAAFFGKKREYAFRASWQTGFQNPTARDMFIYLPIDYILVGNVPSNIARYGLHDGGSWTKASYSAYTAALLDGASADEAAKLLEVANLAYIQPQKTSAWELGCRSELREKWSWDANFFYNRYDHLFLNQRVVNIHPVVQAGDTIAPGTTWRIPGNAGDHRRALGGGIGLDYRHSAQLDLWGNYSLAKTTGNDWRVNLPEHRFNLGISGDELFKNFGYSLSYRWQSGYTHYDSGVYGSGYLAPFGTLNAQVNYVPPAWNAQLKLGATNLFGADYQTFPGGPAVGRICYLSLTFNDLGKSK